MVDPQLFAHHHAHWYPTAAYLYVLGLDALALAWAWMHSRWPGSTCAAIPTTGSTGCAVIAAALHIQQQSPPRTVGGCACWKTQISMRGTRNRPGCPATLPWCSSTRMPTRPWMPSPLRSGAFPDTSN